MPFQCFRLNYHLFQVLIRFFRNSKILRLSSIASNFWTSWKLEDFWNCDCAIAILFLWMSFQYFRHDCCLFQVLIRFSRNNKILRLSSIINHFWTSWKLEDSWNCDCAIAIWFLWMLLQYFRHDCRLFQVSVRFSRNSIILRSPSITNHFWASWKLEDSWNCDCAIAIWFSQM